MAVISAAQAAQYAYAAGFRGQALTTAVAIAIAESSLSTTARGDQNLVSSKWGTSVGLWQIRSLHEQSGTGGSRDPLRLSDPAFNAASAFSISGGGRTWSPWSVYMSGAYKQYLNVATTATAVLGGSSGGTAVAGAGGSGFGRAASAGGVGGVGDFGGVAAAPVDPVTAAKSLYGYLGWFVDHPEVGPIILQAASEGWDAARLQGALSQTNWWRTTSETARQFDALVQMDYATAAQRVTETAVSVHQQAAKFGIKLEGLRGLAISLNALRFGWNPAEIQLALAAEMQWAPGSATGGIADMMNQVRTMGANYLVPVTERQAWEWARKMVAGDSTIEGVESQLRSIAISRFPHLKAQIDQGVTPGQYFAPHRQAVAQLLEVPVEKIDFTGDFRWSPILAFNDGSPGGGTRSMTLGEAARYARATPEWGMTDNARKTVSDAGSQILQTFGALSF